MVNLLEDFDQATTLVSGCKYPTITFVIPIVDHLKNQLSPRTPLPESTSHKEIIKKVKETMLKNLEKRYDTTDVKKMLGLATLLNPCDLGGGGGEKK